MGNSQQKQRTISLVSRPYEETCRAIRETLPITIVRSYGRAVIRNSKELNVSQETCLNYENRKNGCCYSSPVVESTQFKRQDSVNSNNNKNNEDHELCSYGDLQMSLQQSQDYEDSLFKTTTQSDSSDIFSVPQMLDQKKQENVFSHNKKREFLTWSEIQIPIFGHIQNHKEFLHPQILEYFIPFISDITLSTCLSVCPHWFYTIYSYLKRKCQPLTDAFQKQYGTSCLDFESSTISIQPLFTADSSAVRIDLLLYAKVLPQCANSCVQIGYSFSYEDKKRIDHYLPPLKSQGATLDDPLCSTRLISDFSESQCPGRIIPPVTSSFTSSSQTREYLAHFRFEALKKYAKRKLWLQRDMCRFHGDELMVASLPNVPTVCVDDRLEVSVNLVSAFGLVNIRSITWLPPESVPDPFRQFGQHCEFERPNQPWVSLDKFQPITNERLQNNDHFGPQWMHKKTEFTGIDITLSRSIFLAQLPGEVPQSRRWLGIESIVKPPGIPIVCPLPRLGLQHDRFSRQQAREGDIITLYVSQGGGILQ